MSPEKNEAGPLNPHFVALPCVCSPHENARDCFVSRAANEEERQAARFDVSAECGCVCHAEARADERDDEDALA